MEYLKSINEILNTIYLLSGPALVFLAYRGLRQIKIAKENTKVSRDNIRIQSKREAFRLAGEQCVYLAEKTIPLFTSFTDELNTNGCNFFKKYDISTDPKKLSMKLKEGEKITEEDYEMMEKSKYLQDLLNSAEGFSLYFASGVASEKVGFITTGKGYCEMIHFLLPYLIPYFKNGYYKNIAFLYSVWQTKCKKEEILKKQKELENEIKNHNEIKIQTIGTENTEET